MAPALSDHAPPEIRRDQKASRRCDARGEGKGAEHRSGRRSFVLPAVASKIAKRDVPEHPAFRLRVAPQREAAPRRISWHTLRIVIPLRKPPAAAKY